MLLAFSLTRTELVTRNGRVAHEGFSHKDLKAKKWVKERVESGKWEWKMQSPKTCLGAVIQKMRYKKSSTRNVGNVRDVPGTLRQREDSSNPRPHVEEYERVLERSRVIRWRCLGGRTSKTQCSAWVRDIKRGTTRHYPCSTTRHNHHACGGKQLTNGTQPPRITCYQHVAKMTRMHKNVISLL